MITPLPTHTAPVAVPIAVFDLHGGSRHEGLELQ
jgi:hypothetical protein